ncbi:hypothetical protein [Lactococcus petauri]|uniref:hypothetical protein n=1 Tax=Lactococcus petauri TaxID=1940789 RepID=UPI00254FDB59|nr:hypothetical protein [Lactococcus petauri]
MNEIDKLIIENNELKEQINLLQHALKATQEHLEKVISKNALDNYRIKQSYTIQIETPEKAAKAMHVEIQKRLKGAN